MPSAELKALLIRAPYVDWILDGKKTWELRGSATDTRGLVALIKSGIGLVSGTCRVVDVVGPLRLADLKKNASRLNEMVRGPLYYGDHTYAWVLEGAKRLREPVEYVHPAGAVKWVRLAPAVARRVMRQV